MKTSALSHALRDTFHSFPRESHLKEIAIAIAHRQTQHAQKVCLVVHSTRERDEQAGGTEMEDGLHRLMNRIER